MFKRRKAKVVWLPPSTDGSIGDGTTAYQQAVATSANSLTGTRNFLEFTVVKDSQGQDPLSNTATLADIEQSGYRLRRIVGNIFVQIPPGPNIAGAGSGGPQLAMVTAGFIIRRVNPSNGVALATAASVAANFSLSDPGMVDNIMDPWIWRRSWFLGDPNNLANINERVPPPSRNFGPDWPAGNAGGAHVDQKTARIVGPEERLFLDISATVMVEDPDNPGNTFQLFATTDLRVLASMRSSSGNRRNASR